jgi:hypothetical protein
MSLLGERLVNDGLRGCQIGSVGCCQQDVMIRSGCSKDTHISVGTTRAISLWCKRGI